MLIDFHTHIFPDALAARAIESLKKGIMNRHGFTIPAHSDGTLSGLVRTMDAEKVDVSVIMPIATRPGQADGINAFAAAARSDRIVAFGTVHPLQEDWEEGIEKVKAAGFPGIKLHPEFQKCFMDSKEAIRVLKKAAQLGLMVLIHAGDDIGCLPPVHSTPERIRRALDAVPDVTLIAAHMGGMEMWEDAAKYLADTPAYFDTAFVQTSMQPAQFRDLVSLFGARRVLFASDSPWSLPRTQTLAFIERAGILSEEIEDISYKNARALLSAALADSPAL